MVTNGHIISRWQWGGGPDRTECGLHLDSGVRIVEQVVELLECLLGELGESGLEVVELGIGSVIDCAGLGVIQGRKGRGPGLHEGIGGLFVVDVARG